MTDRARLEQQQEKNLYSADKTSTPSVDAQKTSIQHEPVAKACANCWGTGVDVAGKPCPCGCKPHTAPQRRECEWYPEDDIHMPGTWRSDCDVLWTFTDGGPVENEMRYCCGCGATLKERKA